jgi:hypothetical protein
MIWLWLGLAMAEEFHVVRDGETVESIAEMLGSESAEAIRAQNGLAGEAQPAPGTLLRLPEGIAAVSCQPSYVLSHHGSGRVTLPGADPIPLRDYQPLPSGSTVCTDEKSFASVRMSSSLDDRTHNDVTLMPQTCVKVRTSYTGARRTSMLSLSEGEVTVQATSGDAAVVVETASGVALGEDGGFRVAVESEAMRTEAVAGDVATMAQGEQVDVEEGFGNRVRTGEAPGKPVALLPAPALVLPEDGVPLRRPDFTWEPVPRSVWYYLEVSRSPRFDEIVFRLRPELPEVREDSFFLPFDVPELWWRVIPVDRTGFQGMPAVARRIAFPAGVGP